MSEVEQVPAIQFADSRGTRIAYQQYGEGPDVVAVPPTAQNIEMGWDRPELRGMFERFGTFSRWLHFDKRGTGASDRSTHLAGIDERVDDMRAVMDGAGIERAHLFGASEGGPMAILFAVTYPDRVESLILNGTSARFAPDDDNDTVRADWTERMRDFARRWGTPDSMVLDLFAPSLARDREFRAWHQRYERASAGADSILDLMVINRDIDVRELLPEVDVPTLVLHRSGDQVVPVEYAHELAAGIRGARLIEQEGNDHFSYAGDMDGWMDELERWVTGSVQERPSRSTPAAVRITTLGRFAVEVDGEEVPTSAWGSRRARQLCKRLVAARGWPVTRDELSNLLWPDDSDVHKLGARLSVQLSAVRRVLGGGVIADRQTVRLDLDAVTTDLEDFFRAENSDAIVEAYRGEFLPEDRYDDWTMGPREEVRTRFLAATHRRLVDLADGDELDEVVALSRRVLTADEFDEAAHLALINAHRRAGRTGEAQRAHEAYTAAMDELGVDRKGF